MCNESKCQYVVLIINSFLVILFIHTAILKYKYLRKFADLLSNRILVELNTVPFIFIYSQQTIYTCNILDSYE